jgi:DNA-binding CsgD family transcriptional regulator
MPTESKTSPRKMRARDREVEALNLRKSGATYDQIGKTLGITTQGAYKAIIRSLQRLNEKNTEGTEELRRLEVERLDRMLAAIWGQVLNGNQGAIDRALRIGERRAKLLGLDAPTKTDLTTDGKPLTDVIRVITHGDNGSDSA